jgi:hypothetical protein
MEPGISNQPSGIEALVGRYLGLSVPARTVALATHYSGGTFELIDDPGRIGMRLRVPLANAPAVVRRIARYFSHVIINYDVFEYAREESAADSGPDFGTGAAPALGADTPEQGRAGIATDAKALEVEALLLGSEVVEGVGDGTVGSDLSAAQGYFDRYLGTDRAWVVVSGSQPRIDTGEFRNVGFRPADPGPDSGSTLSAERVDLQFDSEAEGGVILAALVPSPHYQSWFGAVVMDEILREEAGPETQFAFPLSTEESVHVMRTPVRIPDYAEDVRDTWLNTLLTMMYEPLPADRIDAVKGRVLDRLGDPITIEWFSAHGLSTAFANGWASIRDLGPDQVRVFASGFYGLRRVAAVWAPAFSEPVAVVEDLSLTREIEEVPTTSEVRPVPGRLPSLGAVPVAVPAVSPVGLTRLASGITLAESETAMVWVGGEIGETLAGGTVEASSPNGALWSFPSGMPADVESMLSGVRADRLLFFFPASELTAAGSRLAAWNGGAGDTTPNPLVGEFATIDIPVVVVLKMWLEARLIEAGWWTDARIAIEGAEGSRLVIESDPAREALIREWIGEAARGEFGDDAFAQARRAAIEHFPRLQTDLQIILWQRAPDGSIPPPDEVTPAMLQAVTERYF